MTPKLSLRNVSKSFARESGEDVCILNDIDLEVGEGDFYTLLGPSGCGKSTLLNTIAGFEAVSSGAVEIAGHPITGPGTDRTVIFQDVSNALFPYMTVFENVEFGPKMSGRPVAERKVTVERYLKLVHLHGDSKKFPFELSGGMKQRVQIARALANDPDVLLMDEPFGALDAITKKHLQIELRRIWQDTGKTVFYITHDIIEALTLSSRLGVMTAGPEATLKAQFEIDLAEPRSPTDPRFASMFQKIEDLIDEEVNKNASIGE
jgi:NitT/TauT family transport system ATP-binding protein